MRLARISLAPRWGVTAAVDAVVLVDATWAAAEAGDAVEHVVARAVPEGFEIGVFLQAEDGSSGRATVDALMRRVLSNSPMLRQWRIVAGSDVPFDSLRN